MIFATGIGALQVAPLRVLEIVGSYLGFEQQNYTDQEYAVITSIRLPRVLFAVIIGATLSVCGLGIQGLFRNPLADAGFIGISSGASLAAVITLVLGTTIFGFLPKSIMPYLLSISSFLGAFITTLIVYFLAQNNGRTLITTMLLSGFAITALVMAITNFITLSASESQLRSITFWNMGSLAGANWTHLLVILPFTLICIIGLPMFAKALNALSLGETNAMYLGMPIERMKYYIIILSALGVGACVSVSGVIGFVGLVVPHISRKIIGSDHKVLFPATILLGALILLIADLFCRTIISPVELPIGVATAFIGAPFFLYLIIKEKRKVNFE